MKKHLKYIIPFVVLFFILPLTVSAAPTQTWGIAVGDEIEMTAGWALDLDLTAATWAFLDTYATMIDPTLDAEDIYNEFQSIDNVFNFKFDITSIDEYTSFGSYDEIRADVSMKAADQSAYGLPDALAIYELQKNEALWNKYVRDIMMGPAAQDIIDSLVASPMPAEFMDNMTVTRWNNDYDSPSGAPLFIPTDYDFAPFYNDLIASVDGIPYFYGNVSEMFGITVTTWDELTAALGFTKIAVKQREVTIKFQFSAMDDAILDGLIADMGLLDPVTSDPITTLDQFLAVLLVTELDFEFDFHLEYTNNGILNNFHVEYTASGKYDGDSWKMAPQFDISRGEHNRINSKYTIPGFPVYIILVSAVATVSVILIRIKKRA